MEDKRYKRFTSNDLESVKDDLIPDLKALGGEIARFADNLIANPLVVWAYDDDTMDLVPGSVYTVNSRLIDRLHGKV